MRQLQKNQKVMMPRFQNDLIEDKQLNYLSGGNDTGDCNDYGDQGGTGSWPL